MALQTGRLIVTEGMDGAGKTVQADLIHTWCNLVLPERLVHMRKEPGSSLNGDLRKMLFHSNYSKDLNQVTAGTLFFLDHYNNAEFCAERIKEGDIVISDRWCYSQYAYDSVKHEPNTTSIELYQEFEKIQIKPDLVLCFEVEPDVADKRLLARIKATEQSDKQWGERGDLSTKVRDAYRTLREEYAHSVGIDADPTNWVHITLREQLSPTKVFDGYVDPRLLELFNV